MDDRLKLICGDDYSRKNTAAKTNAVAAFANATAFCGLIIEGIAIFSPRSSLAGGALGQKKPSSRFPVDAEFSATSDSPEPSTA